MSFSNFIRRAAKSQYFRQLIIRAVVDICVLFGLCVGIWAIMALASAALRFLGVG